MAIAIIAGPTTATGAEDSSFSVTSGIANHAGADKCLVVCLTWLAESNITVSSVELAGTSYDFTSAGVQQHDYATGVGSSIWYVVDPGQVSNAVAVNFSGDATFFVAASMLLSGVDQTTPALAAVGAFGSGSAPSVSISSTAATTDDWGIDAVSHTESTMSSAGSGQVNTWGTAAEDDQMGAGSTKPASAGSGVTLSWSMGSSANWTSQGLLVQAAAAAPAGPPLGTHSLLGVGR